MNTNFWGTWIVDWFAYTEDIENFFWLFYVWEKGAIERYEDYDDWDSKQAIDKFSEDTDAVIAHPLTGAVWQFICDAYQFWRPVQLFCNKLMKRENVDVY